MRRVTPLVIGALLAALLATAAVARVGFPKPSVYAVAPQADCRSVLAYVHYPPGKTGPARKRIPVPAPPGLKATALSKKTIRLEWSLKRAPSTCRAAGLLLSIGHYPQGSGDEWLPRTALVETHGRLTGSTRVAWSSPTDKLADVALASAVMRSGARSSTVRVLIHR
jgi:hypothetical protein